MEESSFQKLFSLMLELTSWSYSPFSSLQLRLFTYLLITHRLNIPQSMKKRQIVSFNSHIRFPLSRSTCWRVVSPLSRPSVHSTQIPSSLCPSFVYLPVSSSRLLAFSSLSSASVCTGVSDSNGLTRVSRSREYQLLFPRRTTPMNNAFPGEIDMQIAECTVDTV